MEKSLEEYITLKEQKIQTQEDQEKIKLIRSLQATKGAFFKMKPATVFGMLEYLEVPQDQRSTIYGELISPQNYHENIPFDRTIIDSPSPRQR